MFQVFYFIIKIHCSRSSVNLHRRYHSSWITPGIVQNSRTGRCSDGADTPKLLRTEAEEVLVIGMDFACLLVKEVTGIAFLALFFLMQK